MTERDPFDILRENNPVDPATLPDGQSVEAQNLLAKIMSGDLKPSRTGRKRRVVLVVVTGMALIAATWAIWLQPTHVLGVVCFDAADLEGTRVGVRPTDHIGPDLCVPVWAEGRLTNPMVTPGEAPSLVGCVGEGESLWVFPGEGPAICDALGLPRALPSEGLDPVIVLQDRLITFLSERGCVSVEETTEEVEETLADLDLDSWIIESHPPHPDRPCASLGFEPDREAVVIIPIPDSGG